MCWNCKCCCRQSHSNAWGDTGLILGGIFADLILTLAADLFLKVHLTAFVCVARFLRRDAGPTGHSPLHPLNLALAVSTVVTC